MTFALSFANTPYPTTMPTAWDYLSLEQRANGGAYYKLVSEARMQPQGFDRMNPVTAAWTIEFGWHLEPIQIRIGHRSEHSVGTYIDLNRLTESFDYVGVVWRQEFK